MLVKMYRHQLVAGKMSLSDTFSIAILNKTFSRHEYIVVAYIRNVLGVGTRVVVAVCGIFYILRFLHTLINIRPSSVFQHLTICAANDSIRVVVPTRQNSPHSSGRKV